MKKIVITLIFTLSLFNGYSNSNDTESKENTVVSNENQYEKLIDLAKIYFNKNVEYAFNCLYKALFIAEENNDIKKIAECNTIMGDIFKEYNSYPTAISYYNKVADNLIKLDDYQGICNIYIKIAQLYQNSEFDRKWSIDAMNKAIKYAEYSNDEALLDNTIIAFGDLYYSQNEYDKAIEYYDKILKKENNRNSIDLISSTLTSKANTLIKKKEFDRAMSLIDSSLYLCIRDFNDSLQVANYSLKANIYDSINDFESAKKYYTQAAKLSYSIKDFISCGRNLFSLANLNQKNNNFNDAINILHIICDSTEKYEMYDICNQSYYQLSHCYATLGQYEEAYKMFNKHDFYHNFCADIYQEEKINNLRNSFLLSLNIKELKTKELEEINLKNDKNEWFVFISIIVVLVMIIITFIYLYLNYKTTSNKNKVITYEQNLKINKIENDLMEHQLKSNRETLINLALHLKSYIELINPLKEDLKQVMELPDNEQKNKIKNIYFNLQNNIQMFNNTESLNKQIDGIYKNFLDNLDKKYPGLTKSEKKLCMMLFTNMSSKEIATLTSTTIRSVETSRYRLRKKIGLSRDEDIADFLQKI